MKTLAHARELEGYCMMTYEVHNGIFTAEDIKRMESQELFYFTNNLAHLLIENDLRMMEDELEDRRNA